MRLRDFAGALGTATLRYAPAMKDAKDIQPEPFGIVSAPDEIDIGQLMAEIRRNVAEKRKAGIYTDEGLPQWTGFLRPDRKSVV